jgi:hypothetical protein
VRIRNCVERNDYWWSACDIIAIAARSDVPEKIAGVRVDFGGLRST